MDYIYDKRPIGIIPARAGFTVRLEPVFDVVGDHPRSRGVYEAAARGTEVHSRIIPARAGFTG